METYFWRSSCAVSIQVLFSLKTQDVTTNSLNTQENENWRNALWEVLDIFSCRGHAAYHNSSFQHQQIYFMARYKNIFALEVWIYAGIIKLHRWLEYWYFEYY